MSSVAQAILARTGAFVWDVWEEWRYLFAVAASVLWASVKPRHWPRTVRNVFARQLYFTGVEGLRFIAFVAALTGIGVVMEAYVWLGDAGLSHKIGPLLVVLIARELGPLFVNFIVIVRSGSAIASEVATMQVMGDVRALEAQGVDPFTYLLMPRVLAMTVATFFLTAVFNLVAFGSGYGFAILAGVAPQNPVSFLSSVFRSIEAVDAWSILAKCTVPALLGSVICVTGGLRAVATATGVPFATTRALSRSVGALFLTFIVISVLVYS